MLMAALSCSFIFSTSEVACQPGDCEDNALGLLQHSARKTRYKDTTFLGCDPQEAYAMNLNDIDLHAAGFNPWKSSWCNRTKSLLDDLQTIIAKQQQPCGWTDQPRSVLSFGCSIGIETREAKARYPGAIVYGYDIDPGIIEKAKMSTDPSLNIRYSSNLEDLPRSFDLVLVNNILYKYISPSDFRSFLKQLVDLLDPQRGLLELMIYDRALYPPCDKAAACEGFKFDPSVAWNTIQEFWPEEARYMPARTCVTATYPSWQF